MGERRPSWGKRLLVAAAIIVALGGIAELALRLIVPAVVAGAVRQSFEMTDDHPVDVRITGSALLNALGGRVGDVAIEVPHVAVLEGVTVTVEATAVALPFDAASRPMTAASASVTVPADQLGAVIALVTSGVATTGEVRDGELLIGRDLDLFGATVPLEVSLAVEIDAGDLAVVPTAIGAGGLDLTAAQIRQFSGSALDGVLQAQTVCLRDRLPAGVLLTDLVLSSTGAVTVTADLAPDIMSNPAQQQPGRCD